MARSSDGGGVDGDEGGGRAALVVTGAGSETVVELCDFLDRSALDPASEDEDEMGAAAVAGRGQEQGSCAAEAGSRQGPEGEEEEEEEEKEEEEEEGEVGKERTKAIAGGSEEAKR